MLIRKPAPVWAPDGTAGGAAPSSSTEGGAGASTVSGGEDTTAGAGGDDDAGGLFDQVEADQPGKDANGKPQRPAWLAEQFWDAEKGEANLEALAKSQRDLRAMIARGEHKPPATADAYQVPTVEGVQDPVQLLGGKDDPLWKDVRTAAHQAGVSQAQMAALLQPLLGAMAKRGAGAGAGDGEQLTAEQQAEQLAEARRAELAKLGPNGDQVVRQTGAWLAGLVTRGSFTADEAKALRSISTAAGVRALAKLRELAGGHGIPVDAMGGGGDEMTQADAKRMMTEGFRDGDQAKVDKARKVLADLEKRGLLTA